MLKIFDIYFFILYYNIMKGGINLTKREAKTFLNVCKNSNIIKFNDVVTRNNISLSAVSRFMNSDLYDDMISIYKLEAICDDLFNSCGCIVDLYREIVLHEKIA